MNRKNEHTDPINHLEDDIPKWFAIFTKYKCEKYVVDKLLKKGITAYIPLLSVVKRYTRKTKHLKLPLISCYAFVCITKRDYVKVLETEYVSGFIKQRKNLISIPVHEMDILRRIVGELEDVASQPLTLEPGSEVEIIGGSLTGIRGKLVKRHGKKTFVVVLESIGYQLEMVIDKNLLSPLRKTMSTS